MLPPIQARSNFIYLSAMVKPRLELSGKAGAEEVELLPEREATNGASPVWFMDLYTWNPHIKRIISEMINFKVDKHVVD
jgi:hypothetical protein